MKVSETFLSIQGEGPMQGRPAFFIRLAGCNLTCKFCDTKYAQRTVQDEADIAEIRDEMLALAQANGPDFMFVITGGEPLVQQADVELLLGTYRSRGFRVANAWIETNGTIVPSRTLTERYRVHLVTSPKKGHVNHEALKALSEREAHFKFVIDEKESWPFEEALSLAKTLGVPNERIWMQPMAQERKNMIARSQGLWRMCAAAGVNLSVRANIWVHGKNLGV